MCTKTLLFDKNISILTPMYKEISVVGPHRVYLDHYGLYRNHHGISKGYT